MLSGLDCNDTSHKAAEQNNIENEESVAFFSLYLALDPTGWRVNVELHGHDCSATWK
jgi:hypothetical protein